MIANQIRLFGERFAKDTLIVHPGRTRFTGRSIRLSDGHIDRRAGECGLRRSEDEVEIDDARRDGEKE